MDGEPAMRYAIGVDIGGTNLRAALVSEKGEIVKRLKEPSGADVPATLKAAVEALMDRNVVGVGLGVAGLVDREGLRVVTSPNLQALSGHSFRDLDPGVPVVMENDASAAAFGEKWLGAGRDIDNFVLLTLGTGIGGGVVHNGRLLRISSEIGHMSIVSEGVRCPCGNNGCLEDYASARAIIGDAVAALQQGKQSMLKDCCQGNMYKITPEEVYRTAFEGDPLSREILKKAGRYLGVGISNVINIFSPEAVVLTGGLIGAWDIYVAEAVSEAGRRAFKGLFENVRILKSALGPEDGGVLGAAGLVLHGETRA